MRSIVILALIALFDYVDCAINHAKLNESGTCEECISGCHEKLSLRVTDSPTCLGIKGNRQLNLYDGLASRSLIQLAQCLQQNKCLNIPSNGIQKRRKITENSMRYKKFHRNNLLMKNLCNNPMGSAGKYNCKNKRTMPINHRVSLEDHDVLHDLQHIKTVRSMLESNQKLRAPRILNKVFSYAKNLIKCITNGL